MRNDITTKMTPEGLRRYNQHIELYGKKPKIKTIFDASFYGLMSEDEFICRVQESDKKRKRADIIIGAICLPIFLGWLAFSIPVCIGYPELFIIFHGPIVGIAGTIFSSIILWRGLKNTYVSNN